MDLGFETDKGMLREKNEDAYRVLKQDKVFVIADGVGGNNSGEIASRMAVDGIVEFVQSHPLDGIRTNEEVRRYFGECLREVNKRVLERASENPEEQGMATTIVAVYFVGNKSFIMNVGDSRVYLFRNGQLTQITEDHTYVNTLVRAGVITEEEAKTHENKNMITRAVGAKPTIRADYFAGEVEAGDIVMMCTDGLYDEVEKENIVAKLNEGKPMRETCSDLVNMANQRGGCDNITLILMKITEEDINE